MKNRTFSVEEELDVLLKQEENASRLINELLTKHYDMKKVETMTAEELELKLKRLELKKKYEEDLESLENGR
jgi:hypothetical protein